MRSEQVSNVGLKQTYYLFAMIFLICAIAITAVYSVSIGQVPIPFQQSMQVVLHTITSGHLGSLDQIENDSYTNIIMQVRMPRVLFALLIGMGLALCGVVMQAIVQNPLADPYILGISSGGSLGATFAILVGFGSGTVLAQFGVAFGAFMGAMITSVLVLGISSIGGKVTSIKLVLSGVVIGALCSSLSSLVIFFANDAEGIKSVTFWTMGSLASASWSKLPIMTIIVLAGCFLFLFQHRVLNTMLLGDESAITLGINLSVFRKLYMIIAALITGTMVAYSGMIGFVGLIIPHICRGLVGSDHKRLMPTSLLLGGLFLMWADVLSRILVENVELPIGILTSVIGSPLFIYMIVKKGYNFGG